jgi:hypothetical protein
MIELIGYMGKQLLQIDYPVTACPDGPHPTLALQLSYRVNHLGLYVISCEV